MTVLKQQLIVLSKNSYRYMKRIMYITKLDYNKVKKLNKQDILNGILYQIHSLSDKDDKWTLTNAWFERRYGNFEVI
jgi:hypothetical protein